MTFEVLAGIALFLAAIPAVLFLANLREFRRPQPFPVSQPPPSISVLIPARNEEGSIRGAVESALASRGAVFEVVVLDDHSEDRTAAIVSEISARDPRVRLESAPALPEGWCGKQHACAVLAERARNPLLLFVDADVRIAPDALASIAAFQQASGAPLVSGFPWQETGTFLERLLLPMMHFLLLSYLPLRRMRRSFRPAFGAGCGQLFMARRDAYAAAGGHGAIRGSLHDGLKLPRAFREKGLATDLFDATDAASCRMYRGAAEVWRGLSKNATEGIGSPGAIPTWTVLLAGGHLLPHGLLVASLCGAGGAGGVAAAAVALSYLPRAIAAFQFRQSLLGAALHPLGVAVLLAIQYSALFRKLAGRPAGWKGRVYGSGASDAS